MEKNFTHRQQHFLLSDDKNTLQHDAIHHYLTRSYWSQGISKQLVENAIKHSLCFGLYIEQANKNNTQIGFARVITDRATFGYLADVYVLPEYSNQGLGTKLINFVMQHSDLQGLRRFMLCTRDAHNLYRKFEFTDVENPQIMMQISRPDLYLTN